MLGLKYSVFFVFVFVSIFHSKTLFSQNEEDSILINFDLGEIHVYTEYQFSNSKEEKAYAIMEEDLRILYPLLLIVREEYKRINQELAVLYEGDREKEFLKWYENYVKESYLHHLSGLNVRQGKLFLKMVSRELDQSPYDLIKEYRNGFRAFIWQGAARIFLANLKTDYHRDDYPMIEYIMKKLEAENNSYPISQLIYF